MLMGMLSLKKVWMDLWISESKYELHARATLAVPEKTKNYNITKLDPIKEHVFFFIFPVLTYLSHTPGSGSTQ